MKEFVLEPKKEIVEEFLKGHNHEKEHTHTYKNFTEKTFGIKYFLASVIEDNKIKTLIPLVPIRSPIFGKRLLSSAFIEYGGPCGDTSEIDFIFKEVKKIFGKDFDYLEIRGTTKQFDNILEKKTMKVKRYKKFILELSTQEELWRHIHKHRRNDIRKAEKSGVITRELTPTDINAFYDLYCKKMRAHGTPPYPKTYFKNFFNDIEAQNKGKAFGAFFDKKLVSAQLLFSFGKKVHCNISVSDPRYIKLKTNDASWWRAITWASKKGYKEFDMGVSREDTGNYRFKKKWNAKIYDLDYYYLPLLSEKIPNIDPENKSYDLLIKVWRKMPLFLTKILGKTLRKQLGI